MEFEEIISAIPQKPYYLDLEYGQVIYCADCREVLPYIPDKSIDLVLTDPPYGVHHKKKGEPYMAGDNINQLSFVLPFFYRLLREDGGLFIFSSTEYLRDALFAFQTYFRMHNLIIWEKTVPIYPHHTSHFKLQYEPIIYGSRGLFYLKKDRCSDVIRCSIERGNNRMHPTQKPASLVKQLIQNTDDSKQTILDPFLGSGTALVCAKKLGRKCIGVEIEERYCYIAAQRLSQAVLPLEIEQVQQRHSTSEPSMFSTMAATANGNKIRGKMSISKVAKETDR